MADFKTGFYPPVSFYFQLSFSGIEDDSKIAFQEVSGISMETNIEEIAEGGENRFKYKLPTGVKYNNLVMKRGLAPIDSVVIKWIKETLESNLSRPVSPKNITVSLLNANEENKVLMRWDFINAYPVKWEVSNINAMDNQVAIGTLEFAYDYFERKFK